MSQRTLATPEAASAIRQMQSIINGGLTDQIRALDSQGRTLSQRDIWDGPTASSFRDQLWPDVKRSLDKAVQELTELRSKLDVIQADIFRAGGNA